MNAGAPIRTGGARAPPEDAAFASEREWHARATQLLGDKPFRVVRRGELGSSDTDMVLAARDFSRDGFLEWTQVWLRELNLPVSDLVSAPLEDFKGTHTHADLLHGLVQRARAEAGDPASPDDKATGGANR